VAAVSDTVHPAHAAERHAYWESREKWNLDPQVADRHAEADHAATLAERIQDYRHSDEFAEFRAREVMASMARCIDALIGKERVAVVTVLALALDVYGAGAPQVTTFDERLREDADWWADIASQPELEAYAGAALRRIERRGFGEKARKRLLVMLWGTLSDDDKREFLKKVDPRGAFRGRGV
jgi:hypothetical protein